MPSNRTALIIGASRGIGLGLVRQLHADGWQVTATVRDPTRATDLQALEGVRIESLDIDDNTALQNLVKRLGGQAFDLLFVNAGILGPAHQSAAAATAEELGQLFLTNVVAPIRLAERLVGQLRPHTGVLAFMSSGLGSVANPEGNNLALYKASKAALNSLTNSFVCELPEPRPTVLSLHPGWVKTDMGGDGATVEVIDSCRGLIEQVERHAGRGGHHFVDYQGNPIAW
ncbi:short-chain dehydrogenase [Pseudomonas daroniae]|uniref:Short-chain dehydrogenase n=1 Tax=Phytopseudomonas daroniae TaxID=2487519 RepID=A0A4V2KB49_9GAMM|nr:MULTISPECIES: SDR family oxidoreductase [Pseudomonas]TBU78600.1 short-chain dehydrogenase [Pseudomonas daroniae]TBU82734.1 short-chain dehydrogenase [Pseudomonas daroniae]TBU86066.1 short-chain dehydrogenase [Pseudomonas sp. FRB 228]TBU95229.1 short-chain dehydrogenase [Pseudomonas daroniae]